ncbi:MAG TPA: hypothetical protein VF895_10490 [Gaiellaceae bacterium]
MIERQVIWLRPGATTFAGLCDECLARPDEPVGALAYRAAKVAGRLRVDADVGFARCDRGHRISLRRIGRTAA